MTYRNLGESDVNLTLTASFTNPNGQPAPAEAVTLSAIHLTVPAGGTASVTLAAPVSAIGTVVDLTRAYVSHEYTGADTTLRLPPGTYGISSWVEGSNGQLTWIVRPWVVLDKNTAVDVDARKSRPIAVRSPRPGAHEILAAVNLVMRNPFGSRIDRTWVEPDDEFGNDTSFGQAGPPAPAGYLGSAVHSQWADAGPNGDFVNSAYLYGLSFHQPEGSFVASHDYTVDPSQLATVTSRFGNDSGENARFGVGAFSDFDPWIAPGNFSTLTFALPGTLTYHLTTSSARWTRGLVKPSTGIQAADELLTRTAGSGRFQRGAVRSWSDRLRSQDDRYEVRQQDGLRDPVVRRRDRTEERPRLPTEPHRPVPGMRARRRGALPPR